MIGQAEQTAYAWMENDPMPVASFVAVAVHVVVESGRLSVGTTVSVTSPPLTVYPPPRRTLPAGQEAVEVTAVPSGGKFPEDDVAPDTI